MVRESIWYVDRYIRGYGWTNASSGESSNVAAIDFGVLNSGASTTVQAYSIRNGATFLGWADLSSSATVGAGERFTLNAGAVKVKFARP